MYLDPTFGCDGGSRGVMEVGEEQGLTFIAVEFEKSFFFFFYSARAGDEGGGRRGAVELEEMTS